MKFRPRLFLLSFLVWAVNVAAQSNNPVPSLKSLSPSDAAIDGPGFPLTVSGSNFVPGSQVKWNGSRRITLFVDSTTLTASILATDINAPGTSTVTVVTPGPGGGASNPLTFLSYVLCGQQLASYKGVAAFSNGKDQGTPDSCVSAPNTRGHFGDQFQCVEFVKRFYNRADWTGDARTYFNSASEKGLVRFQNGGPVAPAPDDILVFRGLTYGHVALVTQVNTSSVAVIEQNWSFKAATLPLNRLNGTFDLPPRAAKRRQFYTVLGWLRKPTANLTISTANCAKGISCTGPQGTIFNFEGTGFTPSLTVRRFVEDSSGSRTELTPLLSADPNGQISWSFNSCSAAVGNFSAFVVDSTSGKTSNTVTETITAGNCPVLLPDLVIAKTASPNPVASGETLTYTITVQNIGGSPADNVTVTDPLPAGLISPSCQIVSVAAGQSGCIVSGGMVTASFGSLAPNAAAAFQITATAPSVSTPKGITNIATVSTTSTESNTTNNQASQTTTVNPAAIMVTISPPMVTLPPSGTQTFTAAVTGTTNTAVTWSVLEGPAGGTITSAGMYTAPNTACIFHVVATSQADTTKSATATVSMTQVPGTFACTGNMRIPRRTHTATLLSDGKVLVVGGGGSGVSFIATAEVYDPATGEFGLSGTMITRRLAHTATLLGNGKVLIAGGFNTIDFTGTLVSAELYDPGTGAFTSTGSMGTAREYHTATLLANGKVLIAGGANHSGHHLASAEIYDPALGTFVPTGTMNTDRVVHTATLLLDGKVLIAGGFSDLGNLASAEIYDPALGTFTLTGSMAAIRSDHTATRLLDGRVLMAAGSTGPTGFSPATELYDPSTGTFTATGSMTTVRVSFTAATLLSDGKVLVVGGESETGLLASAELYDPTTGRFNATGSMATTRIAHTATTLLTGNVVVIGGIDVSAVDISRAEIYLPPP